MEIRESDVAESRKDVGFTGWWRKHRDVEESGVGGVDGAAIWEQDRDAWVGGALVETGGLDGDEVAGGAGVGNTG